MSAERAQAQLFDLKRESGGVNANPFGMPEDDYELRTKGFVLPGPLNQMQCACCAMPVALLYNHPVMTCDEIRRTKILPSMIWGKDVTVVCRMCSYGKCQECESKKLKKAQ